MTRQKDKPDAILSLNGDEVIIEETSGRLCQDDETPYVTLSPGGMDGLARGWLNIRGQDQNVDIKDRIVKAVASMSPWLDGARDNLFCVFCRNYARVAWDNPDRKAALREATDAIHHELDCAWVAARELYPQTKSTV